MKTNSESSYSNIIENSSIDVNRVRLIGNRNEKEKYELYSVYIYIKNDENKIYEVKGELILSDGDEMVIIKDEKENRLINIIKNNENDFDFVYNEKGGEYKVDEDEIDCLSENLVYRESKNTHLWFVYGRNDEAHLTHPKNGKQRFHLTVRCENGDRRWNFGAYDDYDEVEDKSEFVEDSEEICGDDAREQVNQLFMVAQECGIPL